jgi:hypothetical protein
MAAPKGAAERAEKRERRFRDHANHPVPRVIRCSSFR